MAGLAPELKVKVASDLALEFPESHIEIAQFRDDKVFPIRCRGGRDLTYHLHKYSVNVTGQRPPAIPVTGLEIVSIARKGVRPGALRVANGSAQETASLLLNRICDRARCGATGEFCHLRPPNAAAPSEVVFEVSQNVHEIIELELANPAHDSIRQYATIIEGAIARNIAKGDALAAAYIREQLREQTSRAVKAKVYRFCSTMYEGKVKMHSIAGARKVRH